MAETVTLYGIPNCDTVRKARKWLDAHDIAYEFHDYKKKGISKTALTGWCRELGWETLLNRRGTTWRKLDEADRENLNQTRAIALMMDNTSLIKRPVVVADATLLVGFDEAQYQQQFG